MNKYIVEVIVCDWAIYNDHQNGCRELITVVNSRKNADTICEILNADNNRNKGLTAPIIWKDQKIADLEAKLAEKEAELKVTEQSRLDWKQRANTYCDLIVSLNNILPNKQEKEITFAKVIDDVKKLLAEKDKEIEGLKLDINYYRNNHIYKFYLGEDKVQDFSISEEIIRIFSKDKIEFAVEMLEKVKHDISIGLAFDIDVQLWFEEYIDNQIKQLKKE